jgi:hypothetical protein
MKATDGRGKATSGYGSGSNSGRGRGRRNPCGGKGKGSGGARKEDKYLACGKLGHWARDCCSKKKPEESHLTQGEDEEHNLHMVQAIALNVAGADAPPPGQIHVEEQKVFIQLGSREEHQEQHRWVLDTGATNHMSGYRSAFSELDTGVTGSVHFGDGSLTEIEGRGMVVLICKNQEHRALTGVYYIPKLRANIVSIGQLDEAGCRITISNGALHVFDCDNMLIAKVWRSATQLYDIDLCIGQPIWLSAQCEEEVWRWHARYRHHSFTTLRKMGAVEMVRGLPPLDQVDQVCDSCLVGKHRRSPFPAQAN